MEWTLVTGAARGLGAEICRSLSKKGYNIVVHYNQSSEEALKVVQECRRVGASAECIQGDFSTRESLEDFCKRYLCTFSKTRILINNVGNYFLGSGLETSLEKWCDLFQTNLHAPFFLINQLMPSIKELEGDIINIGVAGLQQIRPNTYSTSYMISKSALWLLTKSIATESIPHNVRVNMVSPGYLEKSIDKPKDPSHLLMQREGRFQEIADVITFLLSPSGKYITGQNIEVAGGVRL